MAPFAASLILAAAVTVPSVTGIGQLGTLERGLYRCEAPGDAGGPAGIPREDEKKVEKWCRDMLPSFTAAVSRDTVADVAKSLTEFREYFRDLADKRRKNLTSDLLSGLIAALFCAIIGLITYAGFMH